MCNSRRARPRASFTYLRYSYVLAMGGIAEYSLESACCGQQQ